MWPLRLAESSPQAHPSRPGNPEPGSHPDCPTAITVCSTSSPQLPAWGPPCPHPDPVAGKEALPGPSSWHGLWLGLTHQAQSE